MMEGNKPILKDWGGKKGRRTEEMEEPRIGPTRRRRRKNDRQE